MDVTFLFILVCKEPSPHGHWHKVEKKGYYNYGMSYKQSAHKVMSILWSGSTYFGVLGLLNSVESLVSCEGNWKEVYETEVETGYNGHHGACPTLTNAVIKYRQKQLRGESVYFGSQLEVTISHDMNFTAAGTWRVSQSHCICNWEAGNNKWPCSAHSLNFLHMQIHRKRPYTICKIFKQCI